jgi:hypothetical protein
MKTIILQTISLFNANLRHPKNHPPTRRGKLTTVLLIACLPFCQFARAVNPPLAPVPNPALAGGNTADGQLALSGLTSGIYNSAFGIYALLSNADANFNTGVGAGVLLSNIGSENTAVGAGALLSNTTGSNTAVGSFAMFSNTTGGANTATGFHTLLNNIDGINNAAYGVRPMELNTSGSNNTAIGNLALSNNQTTSDHVCVGRLAGSGLTTANNNVIIGHFSGVHPDPSFGQISDRCFIDNIHGAPVSSGFDPQPVMVDSTGRLGTFVLAAGAKDRGGFFPHGAPRSVVPQSATPDTALNGKIEKMEATIALQQKQIETLTSQLKSQAAQIQKVSAQLQVKKPAAQVAMSKD